MKWPPELVNDLARRRAVLYLGAGVSASATSDEGVRPPDWITFLKRGNTSLARRVPSRTITELIDQNDLLSACELLKNALDESWPALLKTSFLTPGYKPAELHKSLHALDTAVVLTPNFDTIFDRFAQNETNGATVVKNYYDDDVPLVLRRPYRAVLKVHGTIDEPSQMVFTRGDYARARNRYQSFFQLIEALFLTHTFLFVGTSINDPDLRLFLENLHHAHPNSPPHYMTSPNGEISSHLDSAIRNNMNLKLLRYSPNNGHSALLQGIQNLVVSVEAARLEMGPSQNW
ncbi:SIR2 family protein [Pseudarthrobacter oxydans]|uniref:SIR2 family protein n=1 Tax=Pseudarthrobacter oxydans TaxID=1671 RepID=UPI00380A4A4D